MSRSLIDEALEQAKVLGIRNILALRGDPPRSEEYRDLDASEEDKANEGEFVWAIDLVRYIKKTYGDHFCIGVAAYPESHSDESVPENQDPVKDLPYLVEKTKAGADFVMTQLFFDLDAFTRFENLLRSHPSGLFSTMPIIPGLMPVQSYQILKRTTKLSHASLPPQIEARLSAVKGDDEAVKQVGVDIISEIISAIKGRPSPGPRGFHFYTLNLEKAVAFILERCDLIPPSTPSVNGSETAIAVEETGSFLLINGPDIKLASRTSSVTSDPYNKVIVESAVSSNEASAADAGQPKEKINTRANTLAISEGEGSLGREATWDDFPNGRWGDARSPAYGEIDGYGVSLHMSTSRAIQLWGYPIEPSDISQLFVQQVKGDLAAIPWSEEELREETSAIQDELLALNSKGWWTIASQPAVNGVKSDDGVFGWGPRNGFVFQKAFVELFLPSADWTKLRKTFESCEDCTFFASNTAGEFVSSDAEAVNAVTWGAFPGKEIVTPTIIEAVSFKAWSEEAFGIWSEWAKVYHPKSVTAKMLDDVRKDCWLINVVCHDYVQKERLWDILLKGSG